MRRQRRHGEKKRAKGRCSIGVCKAIFLRAGVAKWRKSDEMAAKRNKRRFVTERCDGRFSYKWADNGKEGEKSAEKLTIENKFHVKQFFAARVSHET